MRIPPLAVAPLLLAACQTPPPEFTDADRAQVETEVVAWADQWLAAVQAVDPDAAVAMFDSDGHFIDGASYFPDLDQFRANTEALFATWESNTGGWTRTRVDVLGPDAAIFVGDRTALVRRTDGSEWDVRTLFTSVLRRTDTGWKGLHAHISGSWMPHQSN